MCTQVVDEGKASGSYNVKAAKTAIAEVCNATKLCRHVLILPLAVASFSFSMVQGFKRMDDAVLAECRAQGWNDGACAVAVWVLGGITALVANIGDAKAVVARLPQKPVCAPLHSHVLAPDPLNAWL